MRAELLLDCQNGLGEGIQWAQDQQRLFWVDIDSSRLWSCDEFGQNIETIDLPERLCSFAFDPDNNLLAAFASGLYRLDLRSLKRDLLHAFEPDLQTTRFNDGRCDRQGRFVVGGYNEGGAEPISSVLIYEDKQVRPIIKQVKCSNSIAFSQDGRWMYFTDTATKTICRYPYDPHKGTLGEREIFAVLSGEEGSPDGSCVDAEDALWNAQFRGARVQRYLKDGSKDICVSLPVPNVTCACFGGKNLDTLYITTARHKMSVEQITQFPLSGGLFMVKPGIKGVPENKFADRLF